MTRVSPTEYPFKDETRNQRHETDTDPQLDSGDRERLSTMPKNSYEMGSIGETNPAYDQGTENTEKPNGDAGIQVEDSETRKRHKPDNTDDINKKFIEKTMVQSDFEDIPPPENPNSLARITDVVVNACRRFYRKNNRIIKIIFLITLVLLYFAYFGYAMYYEQLKSEASIRLLWVTCAVVFFVIMYFIRRFRGSDISSWWQSNITDKWDNWNDEKNNKPNEITIGIVCALIIAGIIAVLVFLVGIPNPRNLVSLAGIVVLILIGYIGSTEPARIRWRPVLVGLLMQFIFALLILKTTPGYEVFKFLGDRVSEFLQHTEAGSSFVFDPPGMVLNSFAFDVLPIVIFFSTVVSILYYWGVMQMVIEKVSWVMQILMGTTVGESLNAAGNIFVGMTEAPLLIRPFIGQMTNSELHAVMTGGFATIAGSVMGAYISFGVPANHLLSASVMSAPAALAMAKLFYPETKKSETTVKQSGKMEKSPYRNTLEAACGGALLSIKLVANIAVTLIAFLAILQFLNETLTWFGQRVGLQEKLTFQLIMSYVLYPLSVVMGVELVDCRRVAQLIGVKTFLNEYIAYTQLATMITNRQSYLDLSKAMNITNPEIIQSNSNFIVPQLNKTYENGFLFAERSEVIATYSLCGFANIGSIGILLGGLSGLAPHRTTEMAGFVTRAMIAGNFACFLTACIAGLFFDPSTN